MRRPTWPSKSCVTTAASQQLGRPQPLLLCQRHAVLVSTASWWHVQRSCYGSVQRVN